MKKQLLIVCALAWTIPLSSGFIFAAHPEAPAPAAPAPRLEQMVYGRQIMTPEEMVEYRAKMQAAKTAAERMQIRREHHERMKERAKERGVTLPEEPPVRMGPGGGR